MSRKSDQHNGSSIPDGVQPAVERDVAREAGSGTQGRQPRRGYVAKIAHELRTPLSAIVAASEVMRDEQFGPIGDERYRAYAKDIHDSAQHVLNVVTRVLAQRAAVPDEEAFAFTDIDVEDLVAAMVSTMQPLALRAGLSLTSRIEDQTGADLTGRMPKVIADLTSLRQIVLNLVTNALKFTPDGGSVSVYAQHDPDQGLRLCVSDTGVGMHADEVEAALTGTGQSHEGVREERGLGIGLSIVKTLSERNGAELLIASAPGSGTTVTIRFPVSRLVLG
jgi:two-component system, cell cycle sensor histidine kinase PleC